MASDIMIIGAAGFIGSNLAQYFIQHTTYHLCSLDMLRGERDIMNLAPAIGAPARHRLHICDPWGNLDVLRRIFQIERPRHILVDCAGQEDNLGRIWRVIEETAGIESYTEIYGSGPAPTEWKVASPGRIYRLKTGNIFGTRQSDDVGRLCIQALLNKHSDSCCEKQQDRIHIKDFFVKLLELIESPDRPSGQYSVLGEESASEREIENYFSQLLAGERINVGTAVDHSPHENELVVEQKGSLGQVLEHTLVWYDKNRWFWEGA